jgi:hypothetical protein
MAWIRSFLTGLPREERGVHAGKVREPFRPETLAPSHGVAKLACRPEERMDA